MPRDRAGRFLRAGNEDRSTILGFDAAGGAGKLTLAPEAAKTGGPVCIVFRDAN